MIGRTYSGDQLSRVLSCSLSDDTDVDIGGETELARESVSGSEGSLWRDRPYGANISGLVSGPRRRASPALRASSFRSDSSFSVYAGRCSRSSCRTREAEGDGLAEEDDHAETPHVDVALVFAKLMLARRLGVGLVLGIAEGDSRGGVAGAIVDV